MLSMINQVNPSLQEDNGHGRGYLVGGTNGLNRTSLIFFFDKIFSNKNGGNIKSLQDNSDHGA